MTENKDIIIVQLQLEITRLNRELSILQEHVLKQQLEALQADEKPE